MVNLEIDEKRIHVRIRIRKTKKGKNMKGSDCNVLLAQCNCNYSLEEYININSEGQGLLKYTACDKCNKMRNLKSKNYAVIKSD